MARKKRFKAPKITTVIGSGTAIEGDLLFAGGLHVDGKIHGSVVAEPDELSTLILSEKGTIEGDVKVPNIVLNGKVVGDVHASRYIELAPNARVTGTLYYKLLEMAIGAEVNGQLVFTEAPEPRRLEFTAETVDAAGSDEETAAQTVGTDSSSG